MMFIFSCLINPLYLFILNNTEQDGEIWTFTVRAFESTLPEQTINVNYDGFAEGQLLYNKYYT